LKIESTAGVVQDIADNLGPVGNVLRLAADFQHGVFIIPKLDQIVAATHRGNGECGSGVHQKSHQEQIEAQALSFPAAGFIWRREPVSHVHDVKQLRIKIKNEPPAANYLCRKKPQKAKSPHPQSLLRGWGPADL
jgi:hypothetical protein